MKLMRSKKQIGLLFFAAILTFMLTGCGGQKTDNNVSSPSGDAVTPSTKAEVVEISLYGPQFGGNYQSGEQMDEVSKEIEKRLGIKLIVETHPEEQKFNLLLASGDLPDVIITEKKFIKQLVEGNNVIALDDLAASKGQAMMQEFPQKFEFSKKYLSNGTNKLYFVPGYDGPIADAYTYDSVALVTRWDLYKKLGYPSYSNLDDLLVILKDMQDLEPENEQGQKVYALSPWFDWGLWSVTTYPSANLNGTKGDIVETDIDNNVKTNILNDDSAFWKGITFYNKANRLGILDPDSFTQKFENHIEKAKANRVLFSWVSWSGELDANKAFAQAGQTDKGFQALPPISGAYQYKGDYNKLGQDSRLFAISKNSKHPEKAMELINFLNTYEGSELLWNGIKGTHWTDDNGKPSLKPEVIQQSLNDPNFVATTGIGKYANYVGHGPGSVDPKYNIPLDFFSTPEAFKAKLSDLDKDFISHYNVEYPGQIVEDMVKKGDLKFAAFDGVYSAGVPVQSDDMKRVQDNIIQYLNKEVGALILAKSDDEFAQVKEKVLLQLKKMDIDALIASFEENAKAGQVEAANFK